MKNRILALSCLCVLVLNLAGSAVGEAAANRGAAAPSTELAALLPAVDGVALIDAKRLFSTAMPRLLSANPTMLGKITSGIDEMKADTGVDVRQFESMAVGFTLSKAGAKDVDGEPVVIARGAFSSTAIINAAKTAANTKFREEKAGNKTIYIFSPKAVVAQAQKQVPAGTDPAAVKKVMSKVAKEIAVVELDASTVAFGDIALVRQTISAQRTPVSSELISLAAKKETAVIGFAGKMPGGMSSFLPLQNDDLGKNIDSIRLFYGSMDVFGDALVMNLTARTLQDAQAKSLHETLEGLQIMGKAFLGGSKTPDKQAFARLIDSAKVSSRANEVMFDLQIPQSDIDILVSTLK